MSAYKQFAEKVMTAARPDSIHGMIRECIEGTIPLVEAGADFLPTALKQREILIRQREITPDDFPTTMLQQAAIGYFRPKSTQK